jgi:hypothetical protein
LSRIEAREPPVQNIRQLEAALHREWQQLSQQDIQRLTGGMRSKVEAVIQARAILNIHLHSSKSTIKLSFHFQNVTYETRDDIYCSKSSTGCNTHVLG